MWSEAQIEALSQISEADRQAAAARARRYTDRRFAGMLDAELIDDSWEYAALVGLGVFLVNGRPVDPAVVEAQLQRVLDGLEEETRTLSADVTKPVDDWARGMVDIVKATALIGSAFALGGWVRLSLPVIGDIAAGIRSELGYLDKFARDVAAGLVRRDGRFVRRSQLYAQAGWQVYGAWRGYQARRRGYTEERSVLDPSAEHCSACVDESGKGWQPIGTLVPVGNRQCRGSCRCTMIYRNAAGDVVR